MTEETPHTNPLRTPLSDEEKKQVKMMFIFLGFILSAIIFVSIVIGVVSNILW